MSFIYLVTKISIPSPPESTTSSSNEPPQKSPRNEASSTTSMKSPRGSRKASSATLKEANQTQAPQPQEEVQIFNFDMDKTIVLLDKIKEVCCYQDVEILDLVHFKTGECCMIHTNAFEHGSKFLKKGEKDFACQVKINTVQKPPSPSNTKRGGVNSQQQQQPETIIERTFTSLVTGNAVTKDPSLIPAIVDPTKKSTTTTKKK
nr:unnamed protein product [Naegleria fowleri]